MDSLIIKPTEYSPSVDFNTATRRFSITGESRPENCSKFYAPVIVWLNNFEEELRLKKENTKLPLVFFFKFEYFNSTSAKFILNILQIIKKIIDDKVYKVTIDWNYDVRDDDMLEAGKEFCEAIEIKLNFISY